MTLNNNIFEYNTSKNIKFILLTNFGPFSSHSTFYNNLKDNSMIYGGSKKLENCIKKYQNILVNIHGSNSLSKGIFILEKSLVVNPGNLDKGDFVIIDLDITNNVLFITDAEGNSQRFVRQKETKKE